MLARGANSSRKLGVRFCLSCGILLHATCNFAAAGNVAEAQRVAANIAAARAETDMAAQKLRLFEKVEQPLRLKKLENDIKLVEVEIVALVQRIREYEQFEKFKYSAPLFDDLQLSRLGLVEARLRLDNLREERLHLLRYAPDERKLLESAVEIAQQRMRDAAAGR